MQTKSNEIYNNISSYDVIIFAETCLNYGIIINEFLADDLKIHKKVYSIYDAAMMQSDLDLD